MIYVTLAKRRMALCSTVCLTYISTDLELGLLSWSPEINQDVISGKYPIYDFLIKINATNANVRNHTHDYACESVLQHPSDKS